MSDNQSSAMTWLKNWVTNKFKPKKKKQIQDWDFIMVFEERYRDEIEKYFEKYVTNYPLQENKYQILNNQKEQQILVLLSISNLNVERQATQLKILKKKNKKSFNFNLKELNRQIYLAQEQKNVALCNYLKWIRARQLPQNKEIKQQEKYSAFNIQKSEKYVRNEDGTLFTPEEELRAKYNYLLNFSIKRQGATLHQQAVIYPFTDIMKHAGFIELVPIHKPSKHGPIIPGSIRNYVGANSQSYFDFVSFLQTWLIFPAIVGLATVLFNIFGNYTADDSPGDFLYALVVMIWSIVFITKWQNKQKWTQACEQAGYNEDWSVHQNIVDKKGFKSRESQISGDRQLYVPILQSFWRYFVSYSICISILVATLIFMVLSLNARGFVDQNHKLLYFEQISKWADEGGIFDAKTYYGQIPNIVHILVTNIFDEMIYRPLVKKFTKYEQHLVYKSYENNIIIKYFVYEFIITFADLFYIAFVRLDIVGLREQLLSLFFIDIVRRLVAEFGVPKIKAKLRKYFVKSSNENNEHQIIEKQAILEVNKEDYEPFDDYLEIVTNFGYLVMISSCFPLAPALILFAHTIEALQDKYKIIHIFKRKLPTKYVGMGYWNNIIVFLCYASIITNIMLFAFSSHQIVKFFPKLYESSKDLLLGNTEFSQILQGVTQSVLDVVSNATTSVLETGMMSGMFQEQLINSPFETECYMPPMLQSFIPPSQEHEVQFISLIFIIEHIFLIIFLFLRNILSKQRCQADVLKERRTLKRSIKKYLSKVVLSDMIRDTFVGQVFERISKGQEETTQNKSNSFMDSFLKLAESSNETQIEVDAKED